MIILLFLLSFTATTAAPTLEIDSPINNSKFPYTININLTITTNGTTCYYTLNSGVSNTTIANCANDIVSVDYDGNYSLIVYSEDGGGTNSSTINFEVDRGDYNRGNVIFIGFLLFLIFSIASVLGGAAFKLEKDHFPVRLLLQGFGVVFIIITLQLALLGLREYIKVPVIFDTFSIFYMIFMWFVFILAVFMIVIYLIYLVRFLMSVGILKKWRRR